MLSNGFLFNTNTPIPRINTKNFAINGRIYDTTNTRTLYPLNSITVNTVQGSGTLNLLQLATCNFDTAMGQSWFH